MSGVLFDRDQVGEYAVSRLELKPGDIVLFRSPRHLTYKQVDEIKAELERLFGNEHKIIVLSHGASIESLIREKLNLEFIAIKAEFDKAFKALESMGR